MFTHFKKEQTFTYQETAAYKRRLKADDLGSAAVINDSTEERERTIGQVNLPHRKPQQQDSSCWGHRKADRCLHR